MLTFSSLASTARTISFAAETCDLRKAISSRANSSISERRPFVPPPNCNWLSDVAEEDEMHFPGGNGEVAVGVAFVSLVVVVVGNAACSALDVGVLGGRGGGPKDDVVAALVNLDEEDEIVSSTFFDAVSAGTEVDLDKTLVAVVSSDALARSSGSENDASATTKRCTITQRGTPRAQFCPLDGIFVVLIFPQALHLGYLRCHCSLLLLLLLLLLPPPPPLKTPSQ